MEGVDRVDVRMERRGGVGVGTEGRSRWGVGGVGVGEGRRHGVSGVRT